MSIRRRSWMAGMALAAAAPKLSGSAQELLGEMEKLPVFNTHEHIIPETERVRQKIDLFTLAGHYAINDVISAGLPADAQKLVRDENAPPAKRWEAFAPYWEHAKFTGYGEALRIAVKEVYGISEISGATLGQINNAIAAKNKPGFYDDILRKKAGMRYALLDDYWNPAPVKPANDLFLPARKFDRFIMPSGPGDVRELEKITGVSITSLNGLKQAMERSFSQSLEIGMATVKSTIAYSRELNFAEVGDAAAAEAFASMMRGTGKTPEGFRRYIERPYRDLEDHMFHHLIRLAESHRAPVQIHTGILAGNGNFVANTNPMGLTNLFFLYPSVKFDLFHISYPYTSELASLAKLFPNVYIDFCWAHIISPAVSRRALHEYLETVPANKIFGYGGDYRYPELSYAHLIMARRNIARVLSEKVEEQWCSETEAMGIARRLLYDNAAAVFRAT